MKKYFKYHVENIPYKSIVIDTLVNPLTNEATPLQIVLYYQKIYIGKFSGIKDEIIVVYRDLNSKEKEIIPNESWSIEMMNLANQLKELYPNPENKNIYKSKRYEPYSKYTRWLLALVVLILIVYLLIKRLY